ncbi:MAG: hypothetical protein ACC707_18425 [Thiohalomonadales bacterium]
MDTNQELRMLKAKYHLTPADILDLLTSITGGPSIHAINSWLATKGYKMPANSLDLLKKRLKEEGYK